MSRSLGRISEGTYRARMARVRTRRRICRAREAAQCARAEEREARRLAHVKRLMRAPAVTEIRRERASARAEMQRILREGDDAGAERAAERIVDATRRMQRMQRIEQMETRACVMARDARARESSIRAIRDSTLDMAGAAARAPARDVVALAARISEAGVELSRAAEAATHVDDAMGDVEEMVDEAGRDSDDERDVDEEPDPGSTRAEIRRILDAERSLMSMEAERTVARLRQLDDDAFPAVPTGSVRRDDCARGE